MATSASVASMTIDPPEGSGTLLRERVSICSSIW